MKDSFLHHTGICTISEMMFRTWSLYPRAMLIISWDRIIQFPLIADADSVSRSPPAGSFVVPRHQSLSTKTTAVIRHTAVTGDIRLGTKDGMKAVTQNTPAAPNDTAPTSQSASSGGLNLSRSTGPRDTGPLPRYNNTSQVPGAAQSRYPGEADVNASFMSKTGENSPAGSVEGTGLTEMATAPGEGPEGGGAATGTEISALQTVAVEPVGDTKAGPSKGDEGLGAAPDPRRRKAVEVETKAAEKVRVVCRAMLAPEEPARTARESWSRERDHGWIRPL